MSPASSGALEIERYIGACLISSQQSRHKVKHHHLQQQPPSHIQSQQQHHHHHHLNQLVAGNPSNHSYLPDVYRGYYHQPHQQPAQQHVGAHQPPYQQVGCGDRWAGGLPFIVYAKHQQQQQQQQHRQYLVAGNWPRRMVADLSQSDNRISQSIQQQHQSQDCNNPLSRLAVHTQGAPLILSNNRYRSKNKGKFNGAHALNTGCVNKQLTGTSLISNSQIKSNKCRENSVDTVSVASDESSGSANSENCLPRIIKPRKRRKKDRKPPPHLSTSSTLRCLNEDDFFSTDSGATTSPDITNGPTPILPLHLPPSFPPHNSTRDSVTSESVESSGHNDISETPNLHHSFEDIKDHLDVTDINGNVESSCQCRYCDPSGQIWDIDRNCYSPFLTSSEDNMFRFPVSSPSYKTGTSSSIDICGPSYMDIVDYHQQCLVNDISTFTLEDKDCSIGDTEKISSSVDDSLIYSNHQQHRSQPDLEVSTEIVTSLNGHRDLEIKFFTSPSSMKKDGSDVVVDYGGSETNNQPGYLLLDVKCKKMLASQECD